MDTPVLADQTQIYIHQFCADTGSYLKDLPRANDQIV